MSGSTQTDPLGTGTGAPCAVHPKRPALMMCSSCEARMCADCRVATPVGFKCRTCVGMPAGGDRTDRRRALSGARRSDRRRVVLGVSAAAVVIAAVAGWAATRGGSPGPTSGFARSVGPNRPRASNTDLSVQFQGAGGLAIGADLLLPPGSGPKTPGVLIVPDDGATNRNGLAPANAVPDPLYTDMAEALAADGVASLRYDMRGQGQSELPSGKPITWSDVVGDAQAGVKFLTGRADVDRSRLAVIGDGQGGLVALAASAGNPSVKAAVLVSTPGRPVIDSMSDQLRAVSTPAMGQQLVDQLQTVAAALQAGGPEPTQAQLPASLQPLLPPNQGDYLRSIFALDPPTLAGTVHVPVLVVQGGQDSALAPADAQALVGVLGTAGQALTAPSDDGTLQTPAIVAPTSATTTPMQRVHFGGPQSLTRDTSTVSAIVQWVKTHAV